MGHTLFIPLFFIALGNFITGITRGETIQYYIFYVAIFIPIGVIAEIALKKQKKKNRILSYIFLLFSILSIILTPPTTLNSIFFFAFSLYLMQKTKRFYIIYFVAFCSAVLVKFGVSEESRSTIFVFMAGSAFIFMVYWNYIHPQKAKVSSMPFLSSREKKIINLLASGYRCKDMPDAMGEYLSESAIRGIILKIREKFDVKTNEQLIYKISKLNGWE